MSEQERSKVKRKGDRYSAHTSLIVAAPKKLLSVALNGCCHDDQGLVALAKSRFSQVWLLFILINSNNVGRINALLILTNIVINLPEI